MAEASFEALMAKIKTFERELDGTASRKRLDRVGRLMAKQVDAAVRETPSKHGSLADQSMSHWRRGKPIEIGGTVNVISDTSVAVVPTAKGPMRVLESGREKAAAGSKRINGYRWRVRTQDYAPKYRYRKVNQGATPAKHTWTHAADKVRTKAPAAIAAEVEMAMRKIFL